MRIVILNAEGWKIYRRASNFRPSLGGRVFWFKDEFGNDINIQAGDIYAIDNDT